MTLRLLLGTLGVGMAAFGLLRFLQHSLSAVVGGTVWLAGGVVVHDALLAPLTLIATVLGVRFLPHRLRVRVLVALVVIMTVTATAIPVLGAWGRRPDNSTVLDRNYVAGWLAFVVVVVLASAAGPLWRRLVARSPGGGD